MNTQVYNMHNHVPGIGSRRGTEIGTLNQITKPDVQKFVLRVGSPTKDMGAGSKSFYLHLSKGLLAM